MQQQQQQLRQEEREDKKGSLLLLVFGGKQTQILFFVQTVFKITNNVHGLKIAYAKIKQ